MIYCHVVRIFQFASRYDLGWFFTMGYNPTVEEWDSLCEKVIRRARELDTTDKPGKLPT